MVRDQPGEAFIHQAKRFQFTFECEEGSLEYWLSYFDVSTDYQAMIDSIDPDDTYLLSAAKAGAAFVFSVRIHGK